MMETKNTFTFLSSHFVWTKNLQISPKPTVISTAKIMIWRALQCSHLFRAANS